MSHRKQQTKGECTYCERVMTNAGITRHLPACPQRKEVLAAAAQKPGQQEVLYHLGVRDAWGGDFWLHLEMSGSGTLKDLDRYLRAIWLECCGHLSLFSIGGWRGKEIPKSRRAERVFQPGIELTHIYDFGTSSETSIKMLTVREGKPTASHPIALMARNSPPQATCIECGEPASWLCIECLYEDEVWGTLCERHAQVHPHDDYDEPFPLVNSPRLGMCGYIGPADPPY